MTTRAERSYDGMCQTYWSGGHLCLLGRNHGGSEHRCASDSCPRTVEAPACWGTDAGSAAHGEMPRGARPDAPYRERSGKSR